METVYKVITINLSRNGNDYGPAYVYSAMSYFEHEAHAKDFFKDREDYIGLGPAIEIEVDSE